MNVKPIKVKDSDDLSHAPGRTVRPIIVLVYIWSATKGDGHVIGDSCEAVVRSISQPSSVSPRRRGHAYDRCARSRGRGPRNCFKAARTSACWVPRGVASWQKLAYQCPSK